MKEVRKTTQFKKDFKRIKNNIDKVKFCHSALVAV